jgi:hypothetical protein
MSSGGADAFADRLRSQMLSALELYASVLGDRLGLYRALGDGRERSSRALAGELGLAERYVREWLEQQAVAGVLEVDDVRAERTRRRCSTRPSPRTWPRPCGAWRPSRSISPT